MLSAGVGYDSARATAANILSFVFSNPDINKQFTDFAEVPKDQQQQQQQHPPALRSPKKQQPVRLYLLGLVTSLSTLLFAVSGLMLTTCFE